MNPEDLLIPPPDFDDVPVGPGSGDALLDGFVRVSDYFNLNAIAWPAFTPDGRLNAPPDDHVSDQIARAHDLAPDDLAAARPSASTVAVVSQLPGCDQCGEDARFDAILRTGDRHLGANLCADCYRLDGSGTLGAGNGDVYLLLFDEVSPAVRAACDEVAASLGKPSLWR